MHASSSSRSKVGTAPTKEAVKAETTQLSRKSDDERPKKVMITPRNYLQKSMTADIYAKKPNLLQAPRKVPSSNTTRNVSPMKGLLKSSPSSVSVKSTKMIDRKIAAKASIRKSTPRTPKPPTTNVTVNSPLLNRKPNSDMKERTMDSNYKMREVNATMRPNSSKSKMAEAFTRQRSNTRTLDEDEVKVFKPDVVDNNAEMKNLSRKLSAKPKSFYIDLNEDKKKKENEKASEEEVSYEDDFESYESDFDSYHSDSQSDKNSSPINEDNSAKENEEELEADSSLDRVQERSAKENEEKMLDSGSYDLRDPQRSAQKVKPVPLDFILEGAEDGDKKPSLTDEGFQEMSTSSGAASMKVVHIDVLDRPLFIDFTASRRNRRKRRIFQQLQQRARDILSMITLHEMTYTLFEMKPIPYDLYMATFGRSNYTQTAVQTYDDGIDEEMQTDEIVYGNKWTQIPVQFSKSDIHINNKTVRVKKDDNYRFSALLNKKEDNCAVDYDDSYKSNPLRIYLEQKDGVGSDQILPKEAYKNKLKPTEFNANRLKKFLKKAEGRISNILSVNAGNTAKDNLTGSPKFPFSKGFVKVQITNSKASFAKDLKVTNVIFSRNKTNLVLTVHDRSDKCFVRKCVLCLWELSAVQEPVKVLIATDDVTIGRFWGGCDGVVVAALKDGTIHLWDLSEEATWIQDNTVDEKPTNLVEIVADRLSQTELDREWNLKNSNLNCGEKVLCLMQTSSYTSSGVNVVNGDTNDCIAGLEFLSGFQFHPRQDGGRKVIAQICSLQRIGVLTLWSIVQQKSKINTHETGKAFWSKLTLEKIQTIHITDYLDVHIKDPQENCCETFNLNAAKKRLSNKKRGNITSVHCLKSADDRPRSVASARNRKVLQPQINNRNAWEMGIVCYDLKVMRLDNLEKILIAKNCGEVLCCTRHAGSFNVKRFCVASDTTSITRLELSQNGLPHILAGTDCGAVNLCSMLDLRVLLTLDCMNKASNTSEKYKTDHKGRYVGSIATKSKSDVILSRKRENLAVMSLVWSSSNPFDFFALLGNGSLYAWRLTKSDITPRRVDVDASVCVASADTMALVTSQNEVQIHRLRNDKHETDHLELYQRYLALL